MVNQKVIKEGNIIVTDIIPKIPFYFIRHGQTDWNKEGRLMGQNDIPINEFGIKQAQEVADYLRNLNITIDRIVSSPLLRAKQTAEIISNAIDVPINFHADLKEVCFGEAEGKLEAYENLHTLWIKGVTPEGAESWIVFKQRVIKSIINSLNHDSTTLVVAHGGVYSAIMDFLGYPNHDSDNCVPYIFTPPDQLNQLWSVCNLEYRQ